MEESLPTPHDIRTGLNIPPGLMNLDFSKEDPATLQARIDELVARLKRAGVVGWHGAMNGRKIDDINRDLLVIESMHRGPAIDVISTPVRKKIEHSLEQDS